MVNVSLNVFVFTCLRRSFLISSSDVGSLNFNLTTHHSFTITTSTSPSPANEYTMAQQPSETCRQKLPCMMFLETHFNHGGLDRKGVDMLQRTIEMISAIGWEAHLIFQSKIASASSIAKMEW